MTPDGRALPAAADETRRRARLFTTTVALGRPLLFSEGHPTGGLSEAADPADQSYYAWERADLHRLIADDDVWTDVRLVHVLGDDSGPGRLLLFGVVTGVAALGGTVDAVAIARSRRRATE